MLFGTLCLVTGDVHEAEEVTQEAFVKLWARWDRVDRHPDRGAYLYRTAFNTYRSRYRRALRAIKHPVERTAPVDPFGAVEDQQDLIAALRSLTPRQRAAAVLVELVGMSSVEAGQVLGIAPATVRVLTSRARQALRSDLEWLDE
jgi:RNA polymerase sigma factor (sigma-70 family)